MDRVIETRVSTNRSTRRQHRALLIPFMFIPVVAGCATTDPTSLHAMQNRLVRSLALACYKNNEGFRLVYGDAEVWDACRANAERKIRGTFPPTRAVPQSKERLL